MVTDIRERISLNFHRRLNLLLGFNYPMPESFSSRPKTFRMFWSLYVYVPYVLILLEIASQVVQITRFYQKPELLIQCTLQIMYLGQYLLKVALLRTEAQRFERILSEISAISKSVMDNPIGDDQFDKFFDPYYKPIKKIGICKGCLQVSGNFGLTIVCCFLSWIGMKPAITTAFSWTPYDSSTEPGYTLTCIFEMICFGAATARTAAFDLLFAVMIFVPAGQMKYLKYLMEIMLMDAADEDEPRNISNLDVAEWKEVVSEEVLSLQFLWWIKTHQRTLRLIQELQSFSSQFLAITFMSNLINMFIFGFIAMFSSHWDILQRTLIIAVFSLHIFQLYLISLAGDLLRESSESVAEYGFSALLFKVKNFSRHYLLILTRARHVIQFRFGGVYPLSTETFSKLIQLTVSYFITVIQIRNSQNEKIESNQVEE